MFYNLYCLVGIDVTSLLGLWPLFENKADFFQKNPWKIMDGTISFCNQNRNVK